MTGEIVVCKLYRLARIDGAYRKDTKIKVVRDRAAITEDYMDQRNSNWEDTGLLYERDDAATELYYKQSEEQRKARKEANELERSAALNLANAVRGITTETIAKHSKEVKEPKQDEPKIPEGNPEKNWKVNQIAAWLESKGVTDYDTSLTKAELIEQVVTPLLQTEEND